MGTKRRTQKRKTKELCNEKETKNERKEKYMKDKEEDVTGRVRRREGKDDRGILC
jgi:hypothetical protein